MYICGNCEWEGYELHYVNRQGYCPICHTRFKGCLLPQDIPQYFAVFDASGILGVGKTQEEAIECAKKNLLMPPENWKPDNKEYFIVPCAADVYLRARRLTLDGIRDFDVFVNEDGLLQFS